VNGFGVSIPFFSEDNRLVAIRDNNCESDLSSDQVVDEQCRKLESVDKTGDKILISRNLSLVIGGLSLFRMHF
jgi:hypothetical protein